MSTRRTTVFAFAVAAASCDGQPAVSGMGEPIQVVGGQFIRGDLPGSPPLPQPDGGSDAGVAPGVGPLVTDISLSTGVLVLPGEAGKSLAGRTSGAVAVGVRFADMGTGYWVIPVAEAEPQFPGENNFRMSANFDANDPGGLHPFRFVGIDASGRGGTQSETDLCIAPRVPDNLHSCVPATPPPAAVISLQWDTNFDVDLHVFSPTGIDINPKSHPLAEAVEAGSAADPKAPRIDRDSLGSCVPDGLRQEDLVFQDPPPAGAYDVYADPFAACGQASVRFKLTVYKVMGACPGCALEPVVTQRGELLSIQVTGGSSIGLFITEVAF